MVASERAASPPLPQPQFQVRTPRPDTVELTMSSPHKGPGKGGCGPSSPVKGGATGLSYSDLQKRLGGVEAFAAQAKRPIEEVRSDIARLKRRLKRRDFMLLNPDSRFMQYWDLLTTLGLFYTMTVTPFEVAFLGAEWPPGALFFLNQGFNTVFCVDLVFTFFTPIRESWGKGRGWVKRHRDIAIRYLRGWFVIDLVSILPFDIIGIVIMLMELEMNGSLFMIMKFVRLLRLLKLARVLRASRILNRWDNKITVSYATRALIFWTIVMIVVLHLSTCTWGLIAQLVSLRTPKLQAAFTARRLAEHGSEQGAALCDGCPAGGKAPSSGGVHPACATNCLSACEIELLAQLTNATVAYVSNAESWLCRGARSGLLRADSPAEAYFHALSRWAYFTNNLVENAVYFSIYFVSQFFWSMFIGTICGTVANLDPHGKLFKQSMDELNFFLKDTRVDVGLAMRVREHFRATQEMTKRKAYASLFDKMSPGLRGEVVQQLSSRTLEAVWYFHDLVHAHGASRESGSAFLIALAQLLEHNAFAPKEAIKFALELRIVSRGVAGRGGEMLSPGQFWGEDMIVTSHALRDTRNATGITYIEIVTLSLTSLESVLLHFPAEKAEIRLAATRIALRRAIMLIASYIKMRKIRADLHSCGAQHRRTQQQMSRHRDYEERDDLLRSINGRLPWRHVNEEGQIVDIEGNVIDHDWGKVPVASTVADVHSQLVAVSRVASEERRELRAQISDVARTQATLLRAIRQMTAKLECMGKVSEATLSPDYSGPDRY